jgi:hypothetical protein
MRKAKIKKASEIRQLKEIKKEMALPRIARSVRKTKYFRNGRVGSSS